jgi:hypothetical protein
MSSDVRKQVEESKEGYASPDPDRSLFVPID